MPRQKLDRPDAEYADVRSGIVDLLRTARAVSARSITAIMTATYWEIGRRIVESEMRGEKRADYGERLVERLAVDLTEQFGRGFGKISLWRMRAFFQAWPEKQILSTPLKESGASASLNEIGSSLLVNVPTLSAMFPLRGRHLRIETDRSLQRLARAFGVVRRFQRQRQVVLRVGIAGIDFEHLAVDVGRAPGLLRLQELVRLIPLGRQLIHLEFFRLALLEFLRHPGRPRAVSQRAQHGRQLELRRGIRRFDGDRFLQMRQGLFRLLIPCQHAPELVLRLEVVGVLRRRAFEFGFRLLILT